MKRQAAPVSLTGGQGFSFEDYVAVFFLLHLINGSFPFNQTLGIPFQIHWQCRDMGWMLDDLGIELRDSSGLRHFAAISAKDNIQITSRGFPSNFVNDIWEQWYKSKNIFEKGQDIFVLIIGNISPRVLADWNNLLEQALSTTPERFIERIQNDSMISKKKKALFDSLACPPSINSPQETETLEILKHVRVLHFDFLNTPSQDYNRLLTNSINATFSDKKEDGQILLDKLLLLSSQSMRPKGGSISLTQISSLINIPLLKMHPQFSSDWKKLERFSQNELREIKCVVGASFSFSRRELITHATEVLNETGVAILLGQSGIGKSAIAKKMSEQIDVFKKLWLTSDFFNYEQNNICLENRLEVILENCQSALIVIDGVERIEPHRISQVKDLINISSKRNIKLIVTCIDSEWLRLYNAFKEVISFVSNPTVPVRYLNDTDLSELYKQIPQVTACLSRKEIHAFVVVPKLLDWLIELVEINQSPINMTNFIECLWEKWICSENPNRYGRSQLIKEIAFLDADKIKSGVPISSISAATLIGEFENEGLLKVKNQIVFWSHDLIGDWARLHILIENQDDFIEFIKSKINNPRWQNSIQLFGQWLLSDVEKKNIWRDLINTENVTLTDLFLDSIIFATNSQDIINVFWDYFEENDGDLLKKLLDRLLYVATKPFSGKNVENKDLNEVKDIRLPDFPLWLPIFRQLYNNKEKTIELIYDKVAEICLYILLIFPHELSSYRKEAAELSILAAQKIYSILQGENSWRLEDEQITVVWISLLLAASDFPKEVGELTLELAGRTDQQETPLEEDIRSSSSTGGIPLYSLLGELLPPWPLGPKREIDEQFRKACLIGGNILSLFDTNLEVAKEVLLAVCIESPHYSGGSHLLDSYEIWKSHDNETPCYFQGPWLTLLQKHPDAGMEVIIKLVNFATERYQQEKLDYSERYGYDELTNRHPWAEENPPVKFLLNDGIQEIVWDGNIKVFGWYRNRLCEASILSSALMAVEKWLYEMVDAKQPINNVIEYIVKKCKSVAIGGILCALGKKHPELLNNELKFIISGWQFHHWDLQLQQEECTIPPWTFGFDGTWKSRGKDIYNKVLSWNQLPHRKQCFRDICIKVMFGIYISSSEEFKWFEKLIEFWENQYDDKSSIKFLLPRFSIRNYRSLKKNGQVLIEFVQPENLREEANVATRNVEYLSMVNFPVKCRDILDGRQELTIDQVPVLWQEMFDCISEIEAVTGNKGDSIENSITSDLVDKSQITLAGIAVILAIHDRYILDNDERHNWVVTKLDEIYSHPPGKREFDFPGSVGNHYWDCFWNEAVILLFNKMPKIKILRYWVGLTMFQYHYSAIECALSMAKNKWNKHSQDFTALINLAFYAAATRGLSHHVNRCSQCSTVADAKINNYLKKFEINKLKNDKVINVIKLNRDYVTLKNKIFHKNKISSIPVGINGFIFNIKEKIKLFFNNDKIREKGKTENEDCPETPSQISPIHFSKLPRKDKNILLHKFYTEIIFDDKILIPIIKTAKLTDNDVEKNNILYDILYQMSSLVIWRLAQEEKFSEPNKRDGYPSEFESLVLKYVAFFLIHFEKDKRESLYKPILALKPQFYQWVLSFLDGWFLQELKNNVEIETFSKIWQTMINIATSASNWQDKREWNNYNIEEMWIKMMGMNTYFPWTDDVRLGSTILEMKSFYEQWAKKWMNTSQSVLAFSRFCVTVAGKSIICDGIKWLSEALKLHKNDLARENIAPNISRVCIVLWQEHCGSLEKDKILQDAFFSALNFVREKKCPLGLKLYEDVLNTPQEIMPRLQEEIE